MSTRNGILLVLYGRRRVGKTTLIKEFIRDRPSFYFFVKRSSREQLLAEISASLSELLDLPLGTFNSWSKPLELLFTHPKTQQRVIVFDELQNFSLIDPSFFSELQYAWDTFGPTSKTLCIALGSTMGLMTRIFSEKKEPLFSRAHMKYRLDPLRLKMVIQLLQSHGITKKSRIMTLYAIFGGMPNYYVVIDIEDIWTKPVINMIDHLLLCEHSPLHREIIDILTLEFGPTKYTYYSILQAIATGKNTSNQIANAIGFEKTSISKYLRELIDEFQILEKRVPITDRPDSKRGRYFIVEPFFTFWFRFIFPFLSRYEIGDFSPLKTRIEKELPMFVGKAFETMVKEALWTCNKHQKLPMVFDTIGPWWSRRGDEIDLVALNSKTKEILFVEVKWTKKEVGVSVINNLMAKAQLVNWNRDKRTEFFLIVSKAGFTDHAVEVMKAKSIYSMDIDEIFAIFRYNADQVH